MSQPYKKIRLSSPQKVCADSAIKDLLADIDFEDDLWPEKENCADNNQQQPASIWRRSLIRSIERCDKNALLLQLEEDGTGSTWSCRLESPWTMTNLNTGDLVSIKAEWCSSKDSYQVDKDNGYLITLPDHLLAGTTMMGSLFCRRKGALQELFKGMDCDNEIVSIVKEADVNIINWMIALLDDGRNNHPRDSRISAETETQEIG